MSQLNNVIFPTKIIVAQNMTGVAAVTSAVVDGRNLTSIKFVISWTGTPNGTFSLQESLDYDPSTGSGTWYDNGASINAAAGSAGSAIVNLFSRSPSFYRLVYTNSSSTGVLTCWSSGVGPL